MDRIYTVITGASSGIGYETAKAFAKRGSNLILVARRKNLLEKLQREIKDQNPGLDVIIKTADLRDEEEVLELYNSLTCYKIKTWINNAGFGHYSKADKQSLDNLSSMIDLNVKALALLSILFVRDNKLKEGAQLINVSSYGGLLTAN